MGFRSNKYHAKKIKTEDGTFDSTKEYKRWLELKYLQAMGMIMDLERQVEFELIPSQTLKTPRLNKNGRASYTERPLKYVADFVYRDKDGVLVVEDVKGLKLPEYTIKRKLMLYLKNIQIDEV